MADGVGLMQNLYGLIITGCLVMAMAHLGIIFAYRHRVAPWHAKIVLALGILVALTWLHFRAWEGVARSWIGVIALSLFLISFIYYTVHYRFSPLIVKKVPPKGADDATTYRVHPSRDTLSE